MKTYQVSYRGEFGATVEAEDEEQAIKAFSGAHIEVIMELHPDFFEVEEAETSELED